MTEIKTITESAQINNISTSWTRFEVSNTGWEEKVIPSTNWTEVKNGLD